jgi:hypothetical protein
MRAPYALAVFIGTTIVLVVSMGALGGVGSIELLLAIVLAAAITVLWVNRRRGRPAPQA